MDELIKVLKAFAYPSRIRITKLLEKKEFCVCELALILGIGQSRVSRHLKILKNAGIVDNVRKGKWIEYKLSKGKQNAKLLCIISGCLNDNSKIIEDSKKAKKIRKK
jgi:DNA-binding transcriptional ArsR family regulator